MAYRENAKILKADCLADGVYEIWFETKDIAKAAKAGQFISVYSNDGSRMLPRPISICKVENNNLRIVFRVAGKGTEEFSKMKAGEYLDIQGPLGNGYDLGKIAAEIKAEGDTFFPMFSEEEFVEKSCQILVPQKAVFYEYERVQKKGKFMLSTLKDLWYDGKMVTKEKQLRIFDEKSGKWEVFSPVIFQNCMRPEEVTIYPLTITLLAEDRIQIETKYQQREFDLTRIHSLFFI